MRRLFVLLSLALTVSLSFAGMGMVAAFTGSISSAGGSDSGNGYWQLTSTTLDPASDSKNIDVNISENYASYYETKPEVKDVFAASANWTSPEDTYGAGETVTLTLNVEVEQYDWHGQENSFHPGLNYMGLYISARFDAPDVPYGFAGNSSIALRTEDGDNVAEVSATEGTIHIASDSITVSAAFPSAYKDGQQICLYVSPSRCGNARFLYTWHADDGPAETTKAAETEDDEDETKRQIWLSGIVANVDNEIMPRLRVKIDVFNNADSWSPAGSAATPSDSLSMFTDIEGKFWAEINIPDDQSGDMGLLVKFEMSCILANDHEAFTFANMKYPGSQDKIVAASYIRVPVADKDNKDRPVIPLGRKFSFFYLCVDALSFDSKTSEPDAMWSNVSDNYELASSSYLYNALWDALIFGSVQFDESENLKKASVKVETNWTPSATGSGSKTSHYSPGGSTRGTIRLTSKHSGYDDDSRFTILHEFGHHFDCITNNGRFRAIGLETSGESVNHGGYMNPSTADSFEEGLATAFAIFVQEYRGDDKPYMAGNFNLSTPGNYVSWKANGKFEELAISILLYEVYKGYETKADFWKLLKPDYANFYKYYQAIETDLKTGDANGRTNASRLTKLHTAAKEGGLFKMPFGDGNYNIGEPFVDKIASGAVRGDGIRSDDERYADLMFDTNILGWIDPDTPLRPLPAELTLGKSSDASRNRETIELIPESYLHFDNMTDELSMSLTHLVVEILAKDGLDSKQLFTFDDNKIYLGLTSRPQQGKVIVSIPGGTTLFEGDLEELQSIRETNYGLDVPLDTVDLADFDQDELTSVEQAKFGTDKQKYTLWPKPCEGNPKSDELIKLPTTRTIEKGNDQADFKEKSIQSHITPEYLADIEHGRLKPHPLRTLGKILLIYIIVLIITAVITIVVIRKRRLAKHG